jgi:hypothetical protein
MSEGSAFEFTPAGVQPLAPAQPGGVISASDAIAKLREQVDAQERARTPVRVAPVSPLSSASLKPGSLKKQIRDRLRVVNAELKKMKRLEEEAAELKRLLAAAKAPPAGVTSINSARKSG